MIKIDTDFNFNVLLKLFFSLSKKIIFFSSILANNNLPFKIYCDNNFFSLIFSPPHTYSSLFSFFFPSSPFSMPLPPEHSTFHFLFILSPFSLSLPPECSTAELFFFFFLTIRKPRGREKMMMMMKKKKKMKMIETLGLYLILDLGYGFSVNGLILS